MYFINPLYQSFKLTGEEQNKKDIQIQSVLSIPIHERKNQDKRKIYQYFNLNPILMEIQRSKSLRARILCVSQIQLITEKQYANTKTEIELQKIVQNQIKSSQKYINNSTYLVIQTFPQQKTLAVIKTQVKHRIIETNQEFIRRRMDQLRTYSFLNQFQYHELLYLAHFSQNTCIFIYNQFVFKQNQKADYAYFIEEGEFQVFKNIHLNKENSLKKNINIKRKSSIKVPLQSEASPHKKIDLRITRQEIARLAGGFGQCFGQVQLFMESENRFYSLKCNSSSSKMIKINFRYFQQIFKERQYRFQKMKKQYLLKFQSDLQKIKHNQNLKSKITYPQSSLSSIHRQNSSEKVSQIIFQMQNQHLKNSQIEGLFTLPNNSSIIVINQSKVKKNIKCQRKLYSQNAKKFKNNRYGSGFSSQVSSLNLDQSKTIEQKDSQFQSRYYPVISKTKTDRKLSQPVKLPSILNPAKRHNKLKGLMDISTIVQEKSQLCNLISNIPNPQFSFYRLDQKQTKRLNFRRSQLEKLEQQEKSPAHSESFMRSLVKRSLKKSGYLPQNNINNKNTVTISTASRLRSQTIANSSSFSVLQQPEILEIEKQKVIQQKQHILSKQIRGSLMSNNDFDKFFYRI